MVTLVDFPGPEGFCAALIQSDYLSSITQHVFVAPCVRLLLSLRGGVVADCEDEKGSDERESEESE